MRARSGTSSISARAPASAAAPSPTPRASGRSSAPSAWSTRRSPSRASPAPRVGASATGARTVADLMFADFLFEAAGQIVLQAAKLRYMSNGQMNAPMVVRVGAGAVRSAGPHHSGIYHPVWAHMPGPDRLRALDAGRRQGPDEDGAAGRRSRSSCWSRRRCSPPRARCPTASIYVPFGVARIARAGHATSPSSPPARWCTARSKRPRRSRPRASSAR